MKAYQADIAKFEAAGAKVYGISTDNLPSQSYWAKEVLKIDVPLLSDFMRKASADYGVLNTANGTVARTTFIINADGKIEEIVEGQSAIDPTSALTACSRLKH
jgi:peroxiredoxin